MDKEGTNGVKLPHLRLFVLGAGFSQPVGLPLAKDLLERVREGLRMIYGNKHNPFEQEICEWAKLYPGQTLELERVLGFSHRKHHLRISGSDEDLEYASLSIYAIQKEIQRELLRTTPSKDTIPTLYREFAECLTVHDVVLTFNYDTLLEQSLDLIGKPYSLIPEWKLEKTSGELDAKYVDILKLHGSIDWYDRSYHDERRRWYAESWGNVPDRDPIFGPTPSVPSEPLAPAPVKVDPISWTVLEQC